jgi:hypothetical protein
MHPRITAHSPGRCPICGMALEPVAGRPSSGSTGVDASNDRRVVDIARRRVFSHELYAPAWIESGGVVAAIVYNDELGGLASDETAQFLPAQAPSAAVAVRLAAEPPEPWDRATARARFRVAGAAAVPPGTVGWVRLPAKAREVLVVPSSAILDSPEGPYVLGAATEDAEAHRRPVVIGKVIFGVTTVVSGVSEGERVVARNAFFLDAERRLHGEPSP